MSYSHPREAHERALRDYLEGDESAVIIVHNSAGEREELPVGIFFRGPQNFFPFERAALRLCRGRVLDVGAGTGVHSLYLQKRGFEVVAIDVSPTAVEVMRRRGLHDARLADIGEFEAEPFDTILMMMNGVGILGTLEGLDDYLRNVHRLVAPGGQIILDSGPARIVGSADEPAVEVEARELDYPGETWITLEYRGERGPPFRELYVDSETLDTRAQSAGWQSRVVYRDELGGFVARLTGRPRPELQNRVAWPHGG